jgi:hypothetical protein
VKSVAVVNRADVQQSPSWVRRTDAQNARNHPGRRPAEHAHVLATDGTDSHGNLGPPSLSSAFAEEPPRRSTARWRRSTLWWASTARWPRGGAPARGSRRERRHGEGPPCTFGDRRGALDPQIFRRPIAPSQRSGTVRHGSRGTAPGQWAVARLCGAPSRRREQRMTALLVSTAGGSGRTRHASPRREKQQAQTRAGCATAPSLWPNRESPVHWSG